MGIITPNELCMELIEQLQNMIDATSGQAVVTGKESIRVRMARKRACEFLDKIGVEPRVVKK